jgi:hypothetical protein
MPGYLYSFKYARMSFMDHNWVYLQNLSCDLEKIGLFPFFKESLHIEQ